MSLFNFKLQHVRSHVTKQSRTVWKLCDSLVANISGMSGVVQVSF